MNEMKRFYVDAENFDNDVMARTERDAVKQTFPYASMIEEIGWEDGFTVFAVVDRSSRYNNVQVREIK